MHHNYCKQLCWENHTKSKLARLGQTNQPQRHRDTEQKMKNQTLFLALYQGFLCASVSLWQLCCVFPLLSQSRQD